MENKRWNIQVFLKSGARGYSFIIPDYVERLGHGRPREMVSQGTGQRLLLVQQKSH